MRSVSGSDSARAGARWMAALAAGGLAMGGMAAPASSQIVTGETAVSGTVLDEKGYRIRNVIVSGDGSFDTTDVEGRFGPGRGAVVSLRRGRAAPSGAALRGATLGLSGLPRGGSLKASLRLPSGRRAGASLSVPIAAGRAAVDLDVLASGFPREGLYILETDAGEGVQRHLLARAGGGSWVLSSQDRAPDRASGQSRLRKSGAAGARTRLASVTFAKPGYATLTVPVPEDGVIGKVTLVPDPAALEVQAPFEVAPFWYPSGWAGDHHAVEMSVDTVDVRPGDPDGRSQKWTYSVDLAKPHIGWAAVVWQYPSRNWGAQPGRKVTGASRVVFWARSAAGGEAVGFKTGNDTWMDPPQPGLYKDSFGAAVHLKLAPQWARYEIPLDGLSTEQVISGFLWGAMKAPGGGPVTFWLDEVRFE